MCPPNNPDPPHGGDKPPGATKLFKKLDDLIAAAHEAQKNGLETEFVLVAYKDKSK